MGERGARPGAGWCRGRGRAMLITHGAGSGAGYTCACACWWLRLSVVVPCVEPLIDVPAAADSETICRRTHFWRMHTRDPMTVVLMR